MTDYLILYELQKVHEAPTKTKEEHTLNFRMTKSTEKFNFSEPILNTIKLGLIIISAYNSVFKMNRKNNRFLFNGNKLAVIPGAYKLIKIAELIKDDTNCNVTIEVDKKQ